MRSRELISFDIDGVCSQTNEEIARRTARALGVDFRFEDICDWNLKQLLIGEWGMTTETAEAIFALYRDPNFFQNLRPYPAAQTAALLLRGLGFEVTMNSSRPESCAEVTKQWAGEHFPGIASSRVRVFGWNEKVPAIIGSGAILHIDDHDGTVMEVNAYGQTRAMMLKCPWNRTGLVPAENELENGWLDFLRLALLYRLGLVKINQEVGG